MTELQQERIRAHEMMKAAGFRRYWGACRSVLPLMLRFFRMHFHPGPWWLHGPMTEEQEWGPKYGPIYDPSAVPLPSPKPLRSDPGWNAARKAAIRRDSNQCRKCMRRDDLEVHHIHERVYGGGNDLENLITLCSDCHAEWTFCQPQGLEFERWRGLPPARMLTTWFSLDWPDDVSAAKFKDQFITWLALFLWNKANPP